MASAVIHIVIANELNKNLNRDKSKLLIGTIAPDIAKFIGESRIKTHFSRKDDVSTPDLDKFLNKYKNNLDDDFVMGYYIHLYVDYLWFKYFMPEIYEDGMIRKLNGEIIKCTEKEAFKYIYSDYTNLNIELIDEYDIDLKMFYNDLPEFNNIIEEIPMDKLKLIVDEMGIIIENTKVKKDMIFDINNINKFIKLCVDIIYSDIIKSI